MEMVFFSGRIFILQNNLIKYYNSICSLDSNTFCKIISSITQYIIHVFLLETKTARTQYKQNKCENVLLYYLSYHQVFSKRIHTL